MNNSSIEIINNTVINVIQLLVAKKDTRTLDSLGVDEETLQLLLKSNMSFIGRGIAPIIQIDNRSAQLHIIASNNDSREQYLIKQLIQRDAPYRVMNTNYGMDRKEFSALRLELKMNKPSIGRPSDPDLDEYPKALIQSMEDFVLAKEKTPLDENPDLLLNYSFLYKIGIREVLGLEHVLIKALV